MASSGNHAASQGAGEANNAGNTLPQQLNSLTMAADDEGHYSQSSMVMVLAGSEKREYYIHESLLRQESGYYHGRLSGNWSDDVKKVSLEQEKCSVVEAMIDWIYKRYRPATIWTDLDHEHYVQCYRLADETTMYGFKNRIMDCMRSAYRKFGPLVDMDDVQQAYNYGLGHTEMGKFLVKLVVYAMMNKSATYAVGDQPGGRTVAGSTWKAALNEACENNSELAANIVAEVIQYEANEYGLAWEGANKCLFHDHTDKSTCPA